MRFQIQILTSIFFICLSSFSIALESVAIENTAADDKTYLARPELQTLINKVAGKPGLSKERLEKLFSSVQRQDSILEAIARPAEKTKTWAEYRPIFVNQLRIDGGLEFWKQHHETLARAEKEFGVAPEIVVAIIGVETRYGRNKGSYRVLDALSTLAFDYPPRSPFFYQELEQFLLLENYAGIDIETTLGSYAGAMGFGQFIPSSYHHYAVDFDGDGKIDLINNPVDAIGSVANYFARHGWKHGEAVASRAFLNQETINQEELSKMIDLDDMKPQYKIKDFSKVGLVSHEPLPEKEKATAYKLAGMNGDEYWLCMNNFYVISRYNRSRLYALSVYQLSEMIKMQMEFGPIK